MGSNSCHDWQICPDAHVPLHAGKPAFWHAGRQTHAPLAPSARHVSFGGQTPSQTGGPLPPSQGLSVVVVVVLLVLVTVLVVDVVVAGLQPDVGVQASQQLGKFPTHAWPFFGARHVVASRLTEHLVVPGLLVRQHVTKPGFPQVECAAHRVTTPAQLWFTSVALACPAAQLTYEP